MDHSFSKLFFRAWLVDFVGTRCTATSPLGEPTPPNQPDVDLVFLGQAKRTVYVSDNDGEGWLYGFFLDPEECFGVLGGILRKHGSWKCFNLK